MLTKPPLRPGFACSLTQCISAICALALMFATIAPIVHGPSAAASSAAPDKSFDLAATNGTPRGIWSNGTTMWVTNLSGRLFAYDLATMAPDAGKDIAALAGAGNRNANGVWSNGTTIWVSDDADDKLYAYDLDSGAHQANRDINNLGHANNNHAKGLWSDGTTMWVSDHNDDKIYAYDLATGARKPASDINNLDDAGNQRAAGLWSDGATVWVVDDADNRIYAYDLDSGARRSDLDFDTLAAAGNQSPKGIWSNGATMWVVDNQDDKLYAYNMPSSALLQSLELTGIDIGFSLGRLDYAVSVPSTTTSTTVVATASNAGAAVSISPADADGSASGHQVSLSEGANTITVAVESPDRTAQSIYTVAVNRASADASGWGVLPDFKELAAGNGSPRAIWSDGSTMWVTDVSSDRLFAYDLSTMAPDPGKDIDALVGAGNGQRQRPVVTRRHYLGIGLVGQKGLRLRPGNRRTPARPRHRHPRRRWQ